MVSAGLRMQVQYVTKYIQESLWTDWLSIGVMILLVPLSKYQCSNFTPLHHFSINVGTDFVRRTANPLCYFYAVFAPDGEMMQGQSCGRVTNLNAHRSLYGHIIVMAHNCSWKMSFLR